MTIGIDVRLWNQTGIGRYIRNLVSNVIQLDDRNEYVLFARPEDVDDIRADVLSSRFTIITTDIHWHSIREQLDFPKLLNKYNLDLVHFPYFSVPVFYNKPFVVTVHDLIINHFPTGQATTLPLPIYKLKRMGYEYVLKKTVAKAEKIIVPSRATKEEIVDHYHVKQDKIAVTPEGVDGTISHFEPALFTPKKPYFLYVGNAYPHKNLERLLDSFQAFSITCPGFILKLVGKEDPFYKKLKVYVSKNNIQGVEFIGFVKDKELSKLYSQATATVVPSLMEGFGLTALEAMSMGSLVIASKIPSLEEVCESHAVYFNPNNIISITQALQKVATMSDKDKKKATSEAQKHVKDFSWEKMAKLTLDVYNSCL